MSSSIQFEMCTSNRASCKRCKRLMGPRTLRVRKHGRSYHLSCFRPQLPVPTLTSENMHGIDKRSDVERIEKWIERWSATFLLTEKQLPPAFRSRQVATVQTNHKRLLLIIFAFLSPKEVETAAALSCKEWFHVTREDELWRNLYSQRYSVEAQADLYRQKFIVTLMNSCWHCKEPVTVHTICRRCPIYQRPLCVPCSRDRECRLVSIYWYLANRNIKVSLARFLKFPAFRSISKMHYIHLLRALILPYAKQRHRLLLSLLEKAEYRDQVPDRLMPQLRNCDLERLYTEMFVPAPDSSCRPIAYFCGRNPENTDLPAMMKKVLSRSPSVLRLFSSIAKCVSACSCFLRPCS